MAMSFLKDRIGTLPWVLAGPVLRRVTTNAVTVWLALQDTALVTLSVKDDKGVEVASGQRNTVAVGVNLHIVAVTAVTPSGQKLTEGIVYQYGLTFSNSTKTKDLAGATNSASLSYTGYALPTFALPPSNVQDVRIFHGSCRMPHGTGIDALAILDVLIEQGVTNATARPHQLMLTGDQIYADDVSAALLLLLTDAGDRLLYGDTGGPEVMPVLNKPTNSLLPLWRIDCLDQAGFTSDDLRSHLMSLGEYLAMYLFTWSDVLWPKAGDSAALPVDEVMKGFGSGLPMVSSKVLNDWWKHQGAIKSDANDVQIHYATLFRVRRLLANIPTYMIFDDHEITDDWNMTLDFCKGVYGGPLGRRVVQNGLVAYSLCQHWGNVPESFESSAPGGALLSLLDGKNANDYANNADAIQKIVGVRSQPDQRVPDPSSLIYSYTIEATSYQMIVTDTRTWRTFPNGANTTGYFLPVQPVNQFQAQITGTPSLNGRVLLVVVTTNAPPTEPIRTAARHPWMTTEFGDSDNPDIYDAWDLPGVPFDRLLVALTEKMPLVQGKRLGSAILLSGDVHHSFASHLKYRATRRFEDPQTKPQPASAEIVQLVASSFKKQTDNTVILHKRGYTGAPWEARLLGFVPPHNPEGYVGYNLPAGSVVAQVNEFVPGGGMVGSVWHDIKLAQGAPTGVPTVLLGHESTDQLMNPKNVKVTVTPDYRYRIDYLLADRQGQQPVSPPTIPVLSSSTPRELTVAVFNTATSFYRDYNYQGWSKQQIVGLNNIGEVTFVTNHGELTAVNHTVRWKLDDSADFVWATYNILIDLDGDTIYPDIKADNE